MDQENSNCVLWPDLHLISCWTDGNAAPYVPALATAFPNSTVQAKGLVATEGIVSIPGRGQSGGPLAVRSHFFEFLPQGDAQGDNTLLGHELKSGERYSVVITTGVACTATGPEIWSTSLVMPSPALCSGSWGRNLRYPTGSAKN